MQPGLKRKLDELSERHEDLGRELSAPDVASDPTRFRKLSQEYAQLEALATCYRRYRSLLDEQTSLLAMADDRDPELRAMAREELGQFPDRLTGYETELRQLLVPRDARDDKNIFLEIRAGTGGDEAAIFAGDLFRMYARYADGRHWKVEILNESEGEHGGYKEIIARIQGEGAYSRLKFESGAHRVQRVPVTEAQGRVHTSAATVAVLPELDDVGDIVINPADLKVDTFRASGAGGQHVNKTESAIRITHLPSGVVVECQSERSQHANRDRAMKVLKARLREAQEEKQRSAQAAERKLQVGSGDRSERIRTYNFPQNRITDHRINLTLYNLSQVIEGTLDSIIDPLLQEYQAEELAALGVERA